jgi:hypothetical protein
VPFIYDFMRLFNYLVTGFDFLKSLLSIIFLLMQIDYLDVSLLAGPFSIKKIFILSSNIIKFLFSGP